MKRLFTLAVVLLFVASCATPGQQARTEGTAVGAGLGALVGGGIGALAGGGKGAAIGAATGALLGGVAGYAYADKVARRREELAKRENDLDAQINFARGLNQDTEEYNRQLEQEVETEQQKVDNLLASKKSTQKERNAEKLALQQKTEDAQKQVRSAEDQLAYLKSVRARQAQSQGSAALDDEVKKMEGTLSQLQTKTTTLASLSGRL